MRIKNNVFAKNFHVDSMNSFKLINFRKLSESSNINSYIVLFNDLIIIENILLFKYYYNLNNTSN